MTDINWLENLSEKEKEKLSSYEDQKFIDLYSKVKDLALKKEILNHMVTDDFFESILEWSDNLGTSHYVSDDVIKNISGALASKNLGADEIFIEFKKIKPFKDHNDFFADILWRLIKTRDRGVWPESDPADKININDK